MRNSSYLRSSVLIFGGASTRALLSSTLIAQVESLLENGRLVDAEALLDGAAVGSTDPDILRYLHQCIAFKYLGQTSFRDATQHFVKGAIDPRILISYFEELRPALYGEDFSLVPASPQEQAGDDYVDVEIYAGVRQYMPRETNVDDIIAANLVRNYSPHLRSKAHLDDAMNVPDDTVPSSSVSGTRTHPATIAMREGLREQGREMLAGILNAFVAGGGETWSSGVARITATALALCYAYSRDMPSLMASIRPPLSRSVSRPTSRPPSTSSRPPSSMHLYSQPSETSKNPTGLRSSVQAPLQSTTAIYPHVLAPVLAKLNLWGPLLELWRTAGEVGKLIEVLAGLVEGTYREPSVSDPLGQIYAILSILQQPERQEADRHINCESIGETERRLLLRKWSAWLAIQDAEKGLSLLTSGSLIRTRRATVVGDRAKEKDRAEQEKTDEIEILAELRNAQSPAEKRYLEWLIVSRGRENRSLQIELVQRCIDDLFECLKDEAIAKLWRAKAASYASSPSPLSTASPPAPSPALFTPSTSVLHSSAPLPAKVVYPRPAFISYFTSTTPDSPSKRARIKTLLALQAMLFGHKSDSKALAGSMHRRLIEGGWEKVLALEAAVLHSKLSSPQSVLRTLHALGDNSTAETYASSGGTCGVIHSRVGANAADGCGLGDWAKWFTRAAEANQPSAKGPYSAEPVQSPGANTPTEMLKILLQVYAEDGDMQQASRLLNSQVGKLDVTDIISIVPMTWPLCSVSSFLIRSLRHSLHTRHEGQIVKAISAGQNLEALDRSYVTLREEGAIIEEAVEGDDSGETEESFDEKSGLVEKVAMQLGQGDVRVVNVEPHS